MTGRQIRCSCKVESLAKYKVDIPGGFAYGAFNGAAQVKPWSILRMVENTRAIVFTPSPSEGRPSLLDVDRIYKDYFMFIMTSSTQVRKEFYDIDFVKGPVSIYVELENIGNTSFQLKSSAFLNDDPDPMFICRVATVFVCNKSRQPKLPPAWWKEKFSSEIPEGAKQIPRLDMSDRDETRSTDSNFVVPAADVDGYLHTNWSNYVKYCYNAYVDHLLSKGGIEHSEDVFRNVNNLSILYKKESSIGDSMTARVSPHMSDPNTFYFTISKDKDISCECKIEYHPK